MAAKRRALRREKNGFCLNFSLAVCPEPVLANGRFNQEMGARKRRFQMRRFPHRADSNASVGWEIALPSATASAKTTAVIRLSFECSHD
jgi:hypothetical protein